MRRGIYISCFAVLGCIGFVHGGDGPASYQLTVSSLLKMENMGRHETLTALTALDYTWKRQGKERVLYFDAADVKASKDGVEGLNLFVSRDTVKGPFGEREFKDAPEDLKGIMRDGFGAPLCRVAVDEEGKVVKKSMLARDGAKAFLENGVLANAQIFHAPFPANRDKWSGPGEVSVGNGGYVVGDLVYEKQSTKEARTRVSVSGVLKNDSIKPADGPLEYKNVRYEVRGEQLYDNRKQEWIAGELVFEVSYEMALMQKNVGAVKGAMKLKLKGK